MSRVFIVTGANRGIGFEALKKVAARAAKGDVVVGTARRADDGAEAAAAVRAHAEKVAAANACTVRFEQLDIGSEDSVAQFAARMSQLCGNTGAVHVLVNNAGYAAKGSAVTRDMAELTIDTNYSGTARVTEALLPLLKKDANARVIHVSSGMGELTSAYSAARRRELLDDAVTKERLDAVAKEFIEAVAANNVEAAGFRNNTYAVSKVLLNAFVRLTARQYEKEAPTVVVSAMCPGWCATRMGGTNASRTAERGARTIEWLAFDAVFAGTTGTTSTNAAGAAAADVAPRGAFWRDEKQISW
eukprot:CAMPEP_0198332636 /NCGR_PEP_ID=MMETSP1450-20131203/18411_1 /TAXON_ID=753684 ORGANISM="Madagascaria erythrocladiodes, Strain CCMP3234" /NCGR_SAMPLE_ID=MMETSP1450 /ASSEMBLY_ACC=CAM_ASM_001115 /LENGTH=301 /DNA_ID=CAMNT_0044037099 /DNA_START=65 /DNA_END=970 /DNA_ORIENTATION=-